MSTTETLKQQEVRDKVRAGYAAIAVQNTESGATGCCGGSSCCGADNADDAQAWRARLGMGVMNSRRCRRAPTWGLSCGNPTALAALKAGDVVVDLGSGGGFDVFIAGRKVGAQGRAIGVDMTPEMLGARRGGTRWPMRNARASTTWSFAWARLSTCRCQTTRWM